MPALPRTGRSALMYGQNASSVREVRTNAGRSALASSSWSKFAPEDLEGCPSGAPGRGRDEDALHHRDPPMSVLRHVVMGPPDYRPRLPSCRGVRTCAPQVRRSEYHSASAGFPALHACPRCASNHLDRSGGPSHPGGARPAASKSVLTCASTHHRLERTGPARPSRAHQTSGVSLRDAPQDLDRDIAGIPGSTEMRSQISPQHLAVDLHVADIRHHLVGDDVEVRVVGAILFDRPDGRPKVASD